jgi:uncharacterized protein (TIGR02118 family)
LYFAMAQLIVLYSPPADMDAFQSYYHHTHLPLAKTIPGLRSLTISDGPVAGIAGDAPYLVATLTFDSLEDIQAGMDSPEGQATAADLKNFTPGPTIIAFETKTI